MSEIMSTQPVGTTLTSDRKILSLDDHLIVVKQKVAAGSPDVFVVTPEKEYFTASASYGKYSSSELDEITNRMNATHSAAITSALSHNFAAKTARSWNEGHKPAFMYWVRGYSYLDDYAGTKSMDPYWAKTADWDSLQGIDTFGCGGSWSALLFNVYGIPPNIVDNMSLRLYNPSWMVLDWVQLEGDLSHMIERNVAAYKTDTIGGTAKMQYNVFAELPPPANISTSGSESVKIDFATSDVSNQGNVNGILYSIHKSTYGRSGKNHGFYNAWDNDDSVVTKEAFTLPRYHPTDSDTDYYKDIAIPSSVIKRIGSVLSGHMKFWLVIGPVVADFLSTGQGGTLPGICAMMYFSRVELVINRRKQQFN